MAYTTIDKPSDYFNTKLYTGNGSTQSITGVGFQPDWVWYKNRSATANHGLFDVVRGATKLIQSNATTAEQTVSGVTSFDSDGFGIGSDSDGNGNGNNIVAWNWLAGGSASSNSNGSITSTVSANTTAGFSIVSYTGTGSNATVGHGLGVAPNVIITKKRNAVQQWNFQNSMRGYNEYMALNTTEASQATGGAIISAVSSTTYSCDGNDVVNANSGTYVSYCFAEKKGYSKFGSYVGNQNVDGTFVYLGFKPAFVMVKRTDSTSDWLICDNKRDPHNGVFKKLFPNLNQGDDSYISFDFVSNGFKIRSAGTGHNASGANMIYMALAESPFVSSSGVPTTAR